MTDTATLGLFGLGTMGSALALNILEKGFALHVANRSPEVTEGFAAEAEGAGLAAGLCPARTLPDMVAAMPALARNHPDGARGRRGGQHNRNAGPAAGQGRYDH